MTGWIVLLVLAVLVLLVCLVRLGVAAGYDERGGWVKVHLGPKWVTLYPIDPHKAAKRQEKKARKAEKKAQKPTQEEPDKPTLGGALDLALDLLPDVKEAAGRFRRRLRIDDLTLYLEWGACPRRRGHPLRPGLGGGGGHRRLSGGQFSGQTQGPLPGFELSAGQAPAHPPGGPVADGSPAAGHRPPPGVGGGENHLQP